jgi:Ca2+-binding EF-hand superfamily protein
MKYEEAKALFLEHCNEDEEIEPETMNELFGVDLESNLTFKEFLQYVPVTWEEIFAVFGTLNKRNLIRISKEIGQEMTEDEIDDMMEEADLNEDGIIDWNEFKNLIGKINLKN